MRFALPNVASPRRAPTIARVARAAFFPLLAILAGCQLLGVAASTLPQPDVAASYAGLQKQNVGIMAWADRGVTIDHPAIQPDIAKDLQDKLQQAAASGADEVKEVRWAKIDDILRFQEDHPEMRFDPAEEVAPRLGVTRLIYVEVASVSLHPVEAVDLSRGDIVVNLKVIEISGGKSKVAYQEEHIAGLYPPHAPSEGVAGMEDDQVLFRRTLDVLTTELAKRFISHPPEDK